VFSSRRLDNGIVVVMERIESVRSVALGYWVMSGSRSEQEAKNGISHFLEHMFFKGTARRSAQDIAVDIDSLGGELNAFTSKEGTTFYVKVLDECLARGVELISDIFLGAKFPGDEVEREKGVVIEEIKMVLDTPDDYVHDLFSVNVWGEGGLGQPVLGSRETVESFSRDDVLAHIASHYGTSNIVISCAGNFQEDELIRLLNADMGRLERDSEVPANRLPEFSPGLNVHERDHAEAHVCLGIRGIAQPSQERYAALLLNTVLGGGISSRLFQEVREKRGLVYSIFSFLSSFRDIGTWGIYAGASPENLLKVIEMSASELKGLTATLGEAELERAKIQLKGSILLGLESSTRRMQNIANQQIYYGEHYTPAQIIAKLEAVSLDDAKALTEKLIGSGRMALTVLGPVQRSSLEGLAL
jgi:predicted Zn-dependent peptidase